MSPGRSRDLCHRPAGGAAGCRCLPLLRQRATHPSVSAATRNALQRPRATDRSARSVWIWTASSYPIPTGRPSNAPAASSRSLLSSRTDQPCTATSALAGTESHQPRLLDYEQRQQEEEGEGEEDEEEEEDDEDDEEEDDDELEQQEQQEHAQQQRQRRHSGFSRRCSSSRKRCRRQEEMQEAGRRAARTSHSRRGHRRRASCAWPGSG